MKFSKAQLDYIATLISKSYRGIGASQEADEEIRAQFAEDFARELSKDSPRFPWDRFMARAQGGSEG